MAFVFDEDPSAYVPTYDTETELGREHSFCPLCEVPDGYTNSGMKPIAQLKKVVADLQLENSLSPSAFISFIHKYYNEKTRPFLVDILQWQNKISSTLSQPIWTVQDIYSHFSVHVADNWLSRQEALRQTQAMLKRTAATCLTREGPPNPNTVRTFVELTKLRETLAGKEGVIVAVSTSGKGV